ncbi:BA75_04643T0 [Komagataella pastoris]|uniref:BA75_04643T0 n=1 Tax=Komagataella pastoris TaxID=4922 RepID=A0A1B2JHP9_PICPA|nr:BA75_04643T0 [Komagataella pastoris]
MPNLFQRHKKPSGEHNFQQIDDPVQVPKVPPPHTLSMNPTPINYGNDPQNSSRYQTNPYYNPPPTGGPQFSGGGSQSSREIANQSNSYRGYSSEDSVYGSQMDRGRGTYERLDQSKPPPPNIQQPSYNGDYRREDVYHQNGMGYPQPQETRQQPRKLNSQQIHQRIIQQKLQNLPVLPSHLDSRSSDQSSTKQERSHARNNQDDDMDWINRQRAYERDQEKLNNERINRERMIQERTNQERLNQQRINEERNNEERIRYERINQERIRQEKIDQERIRQEAANQERIRQEAINQERIRQEKINQERINLERIQQRERDLKELQDRQMREQKELQERQRKELELKAQEYEMVQDPVATSRSMYPVDDDNDDLQTVEGTPYGNDISQQRSQLRRELTHRRLKQHPPLTAADISPPALPYKGEIPSSHTLEDLSKYPEPTDFAVESAEDLRHSSITEPKSTDSRYSEKVLGTAHSYKRIPPPSLGVTASSTSIPRSTNSGSSPTHHELEQIERQRKQLQDIQLQDVKHAPTKPSKSYTDEVARELDIRGIPTPSQVQHDAPSSIRQAERLSISSKLSVLRNPRLSPQEIVGEFKKVEERARQNTANPQYQFEYARSYLECCLNPTFLNNVLPDFRVRQRPASLKELKKTKSTMVQMAIARFKSISKTFPNRTDSELFLGYLYSGAIFKGTISEDYGKSFDYYALAALQGESLNALYRLACCYEFGVGSQRDVGRALHFYKKAADFGDVNSMCKLGLVYLKGLLAQPRDVGRALDYLFKATDIDNQYFQSLKRQQVQREADSLDLEYKDTGASLYMVAKLYERDLSSLGYGNSPKHVRESREVFEGLRQQNLPQDFAKAYNNYLRSAQLGYPKAQTYLGHSFEFGNLGLKKDPKKSIYWYSKAASQGDCQAAIGLSGWYLTGFSGVLQQSDEQAFLWARKACEESIPKAQYAMGRFLEYGIGTSVNMDEARRWYQRAATQGYGKAVQRLKEIS